MAGPIDGQGATPGGRPGHASDPPIRVIFVCTGNSARSQMAEALLRREGGARFEVVSAGVDPRAINPLTVRVLAEVGIDVSDATSKPVERFLGLPFDYVITLCDPARVACPVFPGGGETLHWGLEDPAEAEGTEARRLAVFRRVLTEIAGLVRAFVPTARPAPARHSSPARHS